MRAAIGRVFFVLGLLVGLASATSVVTMAWQTAAAPATTAAQAAAAPAAGLAQGAQPAGGQSGRGAQPAGPDMNQFYTVGGDSLERAGVPRGVVKGPFVLPDSKAYPGTQHTYWVHVPAQYDPAVPAHLMIFNDGHAYMDLNGQVRAQNVMDNLIYRRELPVMITVFINPGRRPDQPEATAAEWGDRTSNRPTEYNSLDDKYASVICDELVPALYKDYNISKDPNHRGIGGTSSGAIAAFTVAWQRPDQFRKVLSIVGSFVNLRGGDAYPDLIRKSDKKPLRVFINDGRNDNRGLGRGGAHDPRRDWYFQNVQMVKALSEKGYDLNYAFGINTHSHRMGATMVPEMLRWLWRDYDFNTDANDLAARGFNEPKK